MLVGDDECVVDGVEDSEGVGLLEDIEELSEGGAGRMEVEIWEVAGIVEGLEMFVDGLEGRGIWVDGEECSLEGREMLVDGKECLVEGREMLVDGLDGWLGGGCETMIGSGILVCGEGKEDTIIGDMDPAGIVTMPRRECETVAGRVGTVNSAAVDPSGRTASITVSTTTVGGIGDISRLLGTSSKF